MPGLIVGPLLRFVDRTEATVWVETDAACEVEVLGHRTPTFAVEGHHYALVHVTGLAPGTSTPYEVALDGQRRWPEPDLTFPPSVIRTFGGDEALRLVFGSCRLSLPHRPPYALDPDRDKRGRGVDALHALALRLVDEPPESRPHALLLLGDQVYADEPSPGTRAFIRSRRDVGRPPGDQVADFEEYTRLYWDAWGDPTVRWLLSTVSSSMIFDDHDVHDDWNTSAAWVGQKRAEGWWSERITGALASYWIYQHLGNLSPAELGRDPLVASVREAPDAGPLLREFAERADRGHDGSRWTYARDLGRTRLVVIDSRAGRVLEDGCRTMVDDDEWRFVEEAATGEFDHLLLATSLPFLLAPGMHFLEAWNERVCDGAWGARAARLGERMRQGLDLEHWAAFDRSFVRVERLLRAVGSGERGRPPASITVLSGDVHHAYLAEVGFRRGGRPVRSAVYQATCSPVRNPLDGRERRMMRFGASHSGEAVGRLLARTAGVREPDVRWRFARQPTFDNQVGMLELDGREALLRIERTAPGEWRAPRLETAFERRLA